MKLSKMQLYKVCYCFLSTLWEENKNLYLDDLPTLLGSMNLIDESVSVDPAVIQDWATLIETEPISPEQGFEVMRKFLQMGSSEFYNNRETKMIVDKMDAEYDKMWSLWNRCIDNILSL